MTEAMRALWVGSGKAWMMRREKRQWVRKLQRGRRSSERRLFFFDALDAADDDGRKRRGGAISQRRYCCASARSMSARVLPFHRDWDGFDHALELESGGHV